MLHRAGARVLPMENVGEPANRPSMRPRRPALGARSATNYKPVYLQQTARRARRQTSYGPLRSRPVTEASGKALIVQSDCSVLLEVHSPLAEDARAAIAPFASGEWTSRRTLQSLWTI